MESAIIKDDKVSLGKITTVKLSLLTKQRLDHLKLYKRETYEEIMQRLLRILNLTRSNPLQARIQLIKLEREQKRNMKEMK